VEPLMLGAGPVASRALAASPRLPRAFTIAVIDGESGWAAWSYSRQAKLNAWAWHGIGQMGRINSWATLGNAIYMRNEGDQFIYVMQPDVFLAEADENAESTSVEATTQWLDFGKPGKLKALTGIDFDGVGIETVEVYLSVDGDRAGTLAESVSIGDNQGGWTYSGEIIPLSVCGTEFKIRFVGNGNTEAQVNKMTLHWDELQG
jgi:hypothetical protein